MKYDFSKIEKKWQKKWLEEKVFKVDDDSKKPKYYQLETFPYVSAAGLHVGHPKGYIAEDIHARYKRMNGFEVLYTMGWDAFGLPTENYAIKVGESPKAVADTNIKNFKKQVRMFGLSYDWDREINTSNPDYYKWTQWIFLRLWKKGLAYQKKGKVNWCPSDQTVLANEQVINGKCDRCGAIIEQREMAQWFFKITDYAERLLSGLRGLDWPSATVKRQGDWIGRSEGAEIEFPVALNKDTNFLILHGWTGLPSKNFIPWLKQQLEDQGYKVQAPEMPNTKNPTEEEQVGYILKNCKIDKNTVLVGHSLGGVVAVKVLSQRNKLVQGLVLVAPALDPSFPDDMDKEERPFWKNFKWDFDYDLVKKLAPFRTVLSDLQEKKMVAYLEFLSEKINAKLITGIAKREHFCALEEPIILESLLPKIKIFTTRPDTLFGATYMVLAPEHPLVKNLESRIQNLEEVRKYVAAASHKTELMRQEEAKEKTGVELKGVKAVNPATKEEIPIWIADYVLGSYGTGAIMAVPAHDERDFEFANKFKLPIRNVIEPETGTPHADEVYRKSIIAIVEDPKTGRFLSLNWGSKLGGTLFIGGGIEEGEDDVACAKREIKEETGYSDLEFVGRSETIHHHYFAFSKKVYRNIDVTGFHFRLVGGKRTDQELQHDEKGNFEIEWLSKDEVLGRMEDESHMEAFRRLILGEIYAGNGILANSSSFNGMPSEKAKWEITKFVGGQKKIQFKIRDWSVSRQRYWGAPIPMIHCEKCALRDPSGQGVVPVPEKDLPVILPELENYRPKGVPPLASSEKFIKVKCPECGSEARRDPETLDTFVDSSWYYLRYTDSNNDKEIFDKKKAAHWLPVDLYVIGAEHTVLHLLYSRFITKFLHDDGLFNFEEPFLKLRHQGLILGTDGKHKMSKSKGNVVNPDSVIEEFGVDALRLYEMFMGPFDEGAPWDPGGIMGVERFLNRIWFYWEQNKEHMEDMEKIVPDQNIDRSLHKTIKKIGEDIESLKFNTAISSLMIFANEALIRETKREETGSSGRSVQIGFDVKIVTTSQFEQFVKILHPFAPHLAQELWLQLGHNSILDFEPWPKFDPALVTENTFTLVIQVDGKVRDSVEVDAKISEEGAKEIALGREKIKSFIISKTPKKVIYISKKLVNIVT